MDACPGVIVDVVNRNAPLVMGLFVGTGVSLVVALVCSIVLLTQTKREQQEITARYTTLQQEVIKPSNQICPANPSSAGRATNVKLRVATNVSCYASSDTYHKQSQLNFSSQLDHLPCCGSFCVSGSSPISGRQVRGKHKQLPTLHLSSDPQALDLVGFVFLGLGLWLRFSDGTRAFFEIEDFNSTVTVLIITGLVMLIVVVFGVYGACNEKRCPLLTFSALVTILAVAVVVFGGIAYSSKEELQCCGLTGVTLLDFAKETCPDPDSFWEHIKMDACPGVIVDVFNRNAPVVMGLSTLAKKLKTPCTPQYIIRTQPPPSHLEYIPTSTSISYSYPEQKPVVLTPLTVANNPALVGFVFLGLGLWLRFSNSTRAIFQFEALNSTVTVLIITGSVMLIVVVFGDYGACNEKRCSLQIFSALVTILAVAVVIFGVIANSRKDEACPGVIINVFNDKAPLVMGVFVGTGALLLLALICSSTLAKKLKTPSTPQYIILTQPQTSQLEYIPTSTSISYSYPDQEPVVFTPLTVANIPIVVALVCSIVLLIQTKKVQQEITARYTTVY
ncbi:hypothetical protein F7725_003872 [Dissostichus mawsoni]|uniref:Tetraspanin n=1 Tax=Dissostichus mawsoni TaxID=36200 RepID=A0A7J5YBH8_DISMA|nr:hypothetical protein F7725_003872 [Dissostichus mawsoni]